MWTKWIEDIVAMLLIGDRALTLIGAGERALVWRFGPEGLRNSARWRTEHPRLMHVEGAASIAPGVLPAFAISHRSFGTDGRRADVRNGVCTGLLATMVGGYLVHRQGLRWGATDEEVHEPLPGDEIVPHPMLETTHAISIDAPAAEIWPWLVQMGHYRAGFYADPSWWDRCAERYLRYLSRKEAEESGYGFREVPSDERIIPDYQDLEEGDTILDGPPGTAFFTLRRMEPSRALVLYSDTHLRLMAPRSIRENPRYRIYGEFSWAFVLEEEGELAADRAHQGQLRAAPLPVAHPAPRPGGGRVLDDPQDALRHQEAGGWHRLGSTPRLEFRIPRLCEAC